MARRDLEIWNESEYKRVKSINKKTIADLWSRYSILKNIHITMNIVEIIIDEVIHMVG